MRCSFVPVLFLSLCWHQPPPRSPAASITLTDHILSFHICFFLKAPISLSAQSNLLAVSKNATNNNRKAMVCYNEDEWYLPTVTTWMGWASRVAYFYIASNWLRRNSLKLQIQLCRPHYRIKAFPKKMEVNYEMWLPQPTCMLEDTPEQCWFASVHPMSLWVNTSVIPLIKARWVGRRSEPRPPSGIVGHGNTCN